MNESIEMDLFWAAIVVVGSVVLVGVFAPVLVGLWP